MKKLSLTLQFIFFTLFLNAQTISEINKIRPTDLVKGDYFGRNIDISGNYAIVSAPNQDQIINGNQTLKHAGAAYIYHKDENGNWTEIQKLGLSNISINNQYDFFASSVAISEKYAVVGATQAITLNPENHENINEGETGAVYIYEKNASGNWLQVQKIQGSDSRTGDQFGFEVAVEDDHILVGAIAHTVNEILYAGAIYAFKRNNNGVWEETQKITKPVKDERPNSRYGFPFGFTIAMDENRAIFGHIDNQDLNDPSDITRNVAFIYERNDNGIWSEIQKLIPSDSPQSGSTGLKLDIQGDYIIAAAQGYNRSGTDRLGVAFVFKRNESGIWDETQKITPSSQQVGPSFGSTSVSIDNGLIAIGAYLDDSKGQNAGSTYVYTLSESTGIWLEFQQVVPSDIQTGTEFGWGLAMSNSDMFISAWNSSSTNQNSETVYSYKICNTTTIPDRNFEQWLVNENIDSDGTVNGIINNCDVEKIKELNILPLQGISNLTGISAFHNLERLNIPENDLVTLDLSNNTKLTSVNVFYNFLEYIDITNCSELVSLNVSDNFLN